MNFYVLTAVNGGELYIISITPVMFYLCKLRALSIFNAPFDHAVLKLLLHSGRIRELSSTSLEGTVRLELSFYIYQPSHDQGFS